MKKLSERSKKIIGYIISVILYIIIGTLLLGLILGFTGKLAKSPVLTTLAGYCVITFFIAIFILCPVMIFTLAVQYYGKIKIIGLKQFVLEFVKVYIPVLVILLVISMIINKEPEWIKSVIYSFFVTVILSLDLLE